MEEQTLNDPVADLAPHALQREAARLAQEAFALAFRQTLEGKGEERPQIIAQIVQRLMGWANDKREGEAGDHHAGRHLRQAMLLSGLDQWGLAYAQVYGPSAMTGLSAMVAGLRAGLDGAGGERRLPGLLRAPGERGNGGLQLQVRPAPGHPHGPLAHHDRHGKPG